MADNKTHSNAWVAVRDHLDEVYAAADPVVFGDEWKLLSKMLTKAGSQLNDSEAELTRLVELGGLDPLTTFKVKEIGSSDESLRDRLVEYGWVTLSFFDRETWWQFAIGRPMVKLK